MQAADSLTKFLKSGNDQRKARELLGVEEISSGRMSPQVCGVVSDRIAVSRVFVRTTKPSHMEKFENFFLRCHFGS